MTLSGVTANAPSRSPDDEGKLEQGNPKAERPIGEIVNDAWQKADTLIRQELQLALADAQERVDALKVEVEGKVSDLKGELIAKAIGGAIAFISLMTLAATLVLLLAEAMSPWIAALLVGVTFGAAGFLLLKRHLPTTTPPDVRELLPKRAANSVKQDVTTIKEATK